MLSTCHFLCWCTADFKTPAEIVSFDVLAEAFEQTGISQGAGEGQASNDPLLGELAGFKLECTHP